MVVEVVPLKGGRSVGSIVHPPIGRYEKYHLYTTYILPSGGLYMLYATDPTCYGNQKQPLICCWVFGGAAMTARRISKMCLAFDWLVEVTSTLLGQQPNFFLCSVRFY